MAHLANLRSLVHRVKGKFSDREGGRGQENNPSRSHSRPLQRPQTPDDRKRPSCSANSGNRMVGPDRNHVGRRKNVVMLFGEEHHGLTGDHEEALSLLELNQDGFEYKVLFIEESDDFVAALRGRLAELFPVGLVADPRCLATDLWDDFEKSQHHPNQP